MSGAQRDTGDESGFRPSERGVAHAGGREIRFAVMRGYGHPWNARGDWDLMRAGCDSKEALDLFVAAAARRYWAAWLVGDDGEGTPVAWLYKPGGANAPWKDPGPRATRAAEQAVPAA